MTTESEHQTDSETYNLITEGLPDLFSNYLKPLIRGIAPVIIGTTIAAGGYLGWNAYSESEESDAIIGIKESKLEEKTKEGSKLSNFLTVIQEDTHKTHFKIKGRTGTTLEQMENDSRNKLETAYDIKKNKTKNKYDQIIKDATEKARKEWGFNSENSEKKPTTQYLTNIYKLNEEFDRVIQGE